MQARRAARELASKYKLNIVKRVFEWSEFISGHFLFFYHPFALVRRSRGL